jgi:5-methylcytosine-specific restriction endonuclease McrA
MNRFEECESYQRAGIGLFGAGIWNATTAKLNRSRISPDRVKRKPLPPSKRKSLYAKQSGRCAGCQDPFPMGQLTDDHFNSHAEGESYNDIRNRRLVCRPCNSKKGAGTLMEEARRSRSTVAALIAQQNQLHEGETE